VLGIAIASLLTATSARAIRRNVPPPSNSVGAARPVDPGVPADPYGQGGQRAPGGQVYDQRGQGYDQQPTRPTYTPGTRPDDGWQ
jgi:hypothetical protein